MHQQGYRSIGALARALGMHRNTIHYYLSGHGVFPEKLEKMLARLALRPADILVRKAESVANPLESIAPLVDLLQRKYPEAAFVLFGSRARNTARPYSDWDIGMYVRSGASHERYRMMRREKEEWEEQSPYFVDLSNLNRADDAFLRSAARGWVFLGGNLGSWIDLNTKANHAKI